MKTDYTHWARLLFVGLAIFATGWWYHTNYIDHTPIAAESEVENGNP